MSEPLIVNSTTVITNEEQFSHSQPHIVEGEYLKSMVYGGLDGCINTLVIILSGISSQTSASQILALCVSAIVGDGLGMGLGDYLSARAQLTYVKSEEERQFYEVQHLLNDEKIEIIDIYLEKGFSLQDANRLAELYSTNHQAFVNIMMLEELGLVVGDQSEARKCGLVTLISFMLLGAIPVVPYVISWGIIGSDSQQPAAVLCIGVLELFSLGFAKASMIGLNKLKAGLQTLTLGSIITAIGFIIGMFFREQSQ